MTGEPDEPSLSGNKVAKGPNPFGGLAHIKLSRRNHYREFRPQILDGECT